MIRPFLLILCLTVTLPASANAKLRPLTKLELWGQASDIISGVVEQVTLDKEVIEKGHRNRWFSARILVETRSKGKLGAGSSILVRFKQVDRVAQSGHPSDWPVFGACERFRGYLVPLQAGGYTALRPNGRQPLKGRKRLANPTEVGKTVACPPPEKAPPVEKGLKTPPAGGR